jgi:signal transduction histidine kinase
MEMQNTRRLYRALAHDLRQPATAVLIHLDILRELAASLGDDAQAQMERSLAAIGGVTREFDDAFAMLMEELAPDEAAGEEGAVKLPVLARAVTRLVEPQAAKQGVTFRLDVPGDETPDDDGAALVVRGHRRALKQALLNLTTNALEAMPEGGTLTLRLRRADDGHAEVYVEDDGPGIAPDVQAHMFDLHYSTKAEGSGIGLYAVKRTLEQHGGTVEVESAQDIGTRVRLRLPVVAL